MSQHHLNFLIDNYIKTTNKPKSNNFKLNTHVSPLPTISIFTLSNIDCDLPINL